MGKPEDPDHAKNTNTVGIIVGVLIIIGMLLGFLLLDKLDIFKPRDYSKIDTCAPLFEFPSNGWVGKTIRVRFGSFASTFANNTYTVKINGIKSDSSGTMFTTDTYTDKGHNYLYWEWFRMKPGAGIVDVCEVKE
jgi:hypothetical protein